jgi:uncharacterized protein
MTRDAITWFEIPTRDLGRAQAFYEALLGVQLQRETMGGAALAVFPYARGEGVGGCLMELPAAAQIGAQGTLVYLDASPSLDDALARASGLGGQVATPRTALPPGMGFFAHVLDPEGNRVGLHAQA